MTVFPGHPKLPERLPDVRAHLQLIARRINDLIGRAANHLVDVTLRANQTTTVITDPRISSYSAVSPLIALTANGAAAVAAGIWATHAAGSVTLTHANSANVDQTIRFGIFG